MRRRIPEVGALCQSVRRPAVMIGLGLALAAPAGGWMVVNGSGSGAAAPAERSADADPASRTEAGASAAASAAADTRADRDAADAPADPAVASAWREKALERERKEVAKRFAKEFGISESLATAIHEAAIEADIEPRIAFGLVRTESSFRRTAVSSAGAVGYTQLLPSTARWMEPGTTRSQLFDTRTNLRIGFKYLRYLLDKYDGNVRLALTAYNRGPGTVDRLLKRGRNPENGYATKVLSRRG